MFQGQDHGKNLSLAHPHSRNIKGLPSGRRKMASGGNKDLVEGIQSFRNVSDFGDYISYILII